MVQVRERRFGAILCTKDDPFTTTGSRQNIGKALKTDIVFSQEFCCYALNSLMAAPEHEKNAAAAVAAGGVELVAAARKKHTNARRCVDTAKHLSAAAAEQDL
jgi:hypothetical protein